MANIRPSNEISLNNRKTLKTMKFGAKIAKADTSKLKTLWEIIEYTPKESKIESAETKSIRITLLESSPRKINKRKKASMLKRHIRKKFREGLTRYRFFAVIMKAVENVIRKDIANDQ